MKFVPQLLARGTLLLALAGVAPPVHAGGSAAIGAGTNWTNHNGDTDETAYSQLDQIQKPMWAAWAWPGRSTLPGEVRLEATPLAVDGVLYFTGSCGKVYAVDGVSGKMLWTYDPQIWKHQSGQDASTALPSIAAWPMPTGGFSPPRWTAG